MSIRDKRMSELFLGGTQGYIFSRIFKWHTKKKGWEKVIYSVYMSTLGLFRFP